LIGGVLGAALDQIHVQFGVLSYPPEVASFLGQPWWVAPNFGLGALLMLTAARPFASAIEGRAETPDARRYLIDSAWFVGAYLASGILKDQPLILALAYLVSWAGRIAIRRAGIPVALYSIGLGAGGAIYESTLSSTGAFTYLVPVLFRVPIWLPGLYAHGAPLAISMALTMRARRAARPTSAPLRGPVL
jgi:hypothetical protein